MNIEILLLVHVHFFMFILCIHIYVSLDIAKHIDLQTAVWTTFVFHELRRSEAQECKQRLRRNYTRISVVEGSQKPQFWDKREEEKCRVKIAIDCQKVPVNEIWDGLRTDDEKVLSTFFRPIRCELDFCRGVENVYAVVTSPDERKNCSKEEATTVMQYDAKERKKKINENETATCYRHLHFLWHHWKPTVK